MTELDAELQAHKARSKATWMAGNYAKWAACLEPEARNFVARLEVTPGLRVLDVACGTGNVSLPAARLGANVVGVDIATTSLEYGRQRARDEGLDAKSTFSVRFEEGDVEQLPFEDGLFDLVTSFFGVIYAPRQERAAAELIRVCKPGGRIALANWTAQGLTAELFAATGKFFPPAPNGPPSPLLWGDEAVMRERFGAHASELQFTPRTLTFEFPFGPSEVVDFFRQYNGPTVRAFEQLKSADQDALRRDLTAVWTNYNHATDGTTRASADYLEVIVHRA